MFIFPRSSVVVCDLSGLCAKRQERQRLLSAPLWRDRQGGVEHEGFAAPQRGEQRERASYAGELCGVEDDRVRERRGIAWPGERHLHACLALLEHLDDVAIQREDEQLAVDDATYANI